MEVRWFHSWKLNRTRMKDEATIRSDATTLNDKVTFLSKLQTYPDTLTLEVIETHMSWVFLTDLFVYKLKKPVRYDFLDFTLLDLRHKYCLEEVRINRKLAKGIYQGVVPLTTHKNLLQLNGAGEIIDWLVKMKRLPELKMLDKAITTDSIDSQDLHRAAEKLVNFYLTSRPVKPEEKLFRRQIINDIAHNCKELLRDEFDLPHAVIIRIEADLLHFILKYKQVFNKRLEDGRIVDGHGDLRPEHICLTPTPVIIDRIEFNRELRIMDVAEELSHFALECEILGSPYAGKLFLNVYERKSHERIPVVLICFYKAKRALLRAKLSVHHLLEKQYIVEIDKWKNRCEEYLQIANSYCDQLRDEQKVRN